MGAQGVFCASFTACRTAVWTSVSPCGSSSAPGTKHLPCSGRRTNELARDRGFSHCGVASPLPMNSNVRVTSPRGSFSDVTRALRGLRQPLSRLVTRSRSCPPNSPVVPITRANLAPNWSAFVARSRADGRRSAFGHWPHIAGARAVRCCVPRSHRVRWLRLLLVVGGGAGCYV